MKAIVITEPGGTDKLALRDVPEPELKPGHVLIDVAATALNRADLLQRRGLYPPPKGETDIMGLECAGTVAEVASDVDSVRVGDRVMALLPGGGYAERVAVPAGMAVPVPESLSFEQAAAVPEAFLTAREALFTLGGVGKGSVVLVHAAAGGVGSAAVQLASRAGATVIATAGSEPKLELARTLGAAHVVNYKEADFAEVARDVTGKAGVDAVLDFIGASYWPQHERCLKVGGRNVVIGVMGGAKVEVNFGRVLAKRLQILGLVMRSRPVADKVAITARFVEESLPDFDAGELKPVLDRSFPLAEAAAAHEHMEANRNLGKIVLTLR